MSREAWGVVAAVAVALVFLVAGVAKLAAVGDWRRQSESMGVPWWLARAVPVIEVAVGALLLVQFQRHLMASIAVGMLTAFTTLVVFRLAEGRRPVCACFGSWRPTPIGASTIVRNVVIAAVGVAAAVL